MGYEAYIAAHDHCWKFIYCQQGFTGRPYCELLDVIPGELKRRGPYRALRSDGSRDILFIAKPPFEVYKLWHKAILSFHGSSPNSIVETQHGHLILNLKDTIYVNGLLTECHRKSFCFGYHVFQDHRIGGYTDDTDQDTQSGIIAKIWADAIAYHGDITIPAVVELFEHPMCEDTQAVASALSRTTAESIWRHLSGGVGLFYYRDAEAHDKVEVSSFVLGIVIYFTKICYFLGQASLS